MASAEQLLHEAQYAFQSISFGDSRDNRRNASRAKRLCRKIIRKYPGSTEAVEADAILMRLGEEAYVSKVKPVSTPQPEMAFADDVGTETVNWSGLIALLFALPKTILALIVVGAYFLFSVFGPLLFVPLIALVLLTGPFRRFLKREQRVQLNGIVDRINAYIATNTLSIAGLVLMLSVVSAQASPLFDDDTVVDVRLAGPIETLIDTQKDEQELPFTLTADGVDHEVRVRTRGKSRLRVCKFPMLRVNFRSKHVLGTVFQGQDKLKLVTHCRKSKPAGQDVLQEYLAYRIFGLLTDASYRVRLLRVDYVDTNDPNASQLRYAFAVEPDEQLADRIGANKRHQDSVSLASLNANQAALVYVFQYLIGNTDWSLVKADKDKFCRHNIELFESGSELFLVPRDFDLAGIVNAFYARPDASLRIDSVTKRLYRGFCTEPDVLRSALQRITALQADIMAMPATTPGLTDKDRRSTSKYLKAFFDKAKNEQKLLEHFDARCL